MSQSKCLRLATATPWYVSNRQIHEDLSVPLFAVHIRVLTASLRPQLALWLGLVYRTWGVAKGAEVGDRLLPAVPGFI